MPSDEGVAAPLIFRGEKGAKLPGVMQPIIWFCLQEAQ
jgi:hypothetical protein